MNINKAIPERFLDWFGRIGSIVHFGISFWKHFFRPPFEWRELISQVYLLGYKSFVLIGTTSLIVGMVFTMQSYPTMASLGTQSWIPTMISISMVREIGPLITGLIFAGKVGSGIGAELGSMRVTEQIDAMEVSGTKPMNFLVVTRVMAATIAVPLLVLYADLLSFTGSYLALSSVEDITLQLFLNQVMTAITFIDLLPSLLKSAFFGLAVGLVSCYQGYTANKGTRGVGQAANVSVVVSSFIIFLIDLIMVQIQSLYL